MIRRNAERQQRQAAGVDADQDEVRPQAPTLPDDFEPFAPEQKETIADYTEAFQLYSRALHSATTTIDSSGFETWRRLHVTYDQGEKAQQLGTLSRIMKPTWNNVTQSPNEFSQHFQNWRDKIFNYQTTVQTEIATSMKMALLMQYIQGDIRSHLLLTESLATANFDDAATKVENYYRNVYIYIDNNSAGGIQAFKGKCYKGKGKDKKGKGDYNQQKGKGYLTDHQQYPQHTYQKGKGKGKYGQRPSSSKGKGYNCYNNYNRPKGSYDNNRKGVGKGSKGNHQTATFHRYHHTKARDQQKENEPTSCATTAENPDTHLTNAGGKDKSTTLINHNLSGQYQMTISLNNYNRCLNTPQPPQQ
eukprot:4949954-Amphidinium_carterae.1